MRLRDPGLWNVTALRYLRTSTRTALDSKAQGRRAGAPWVAVPNEDEKAQRGLTTVISTRVVEPRWGSWLRVHRRPRVRLRDPGLWNVTALRYLRTSTPTALDSKAQGRRTGAPWVAVPNEHEKPQRGLTTVISTRIVEPRWGSWLRVHRRPRVRLRDPGLRNVTALRYLHTSTPTALDSKAQGRRAGAPWVAVPNEDEKPQRGLTIVIGTRIVEPRWGSWLPVHRRPRVCLRDRGLRNVTALRYLHTFTPTALDSKAQGRLAGAPWVAVPNEHEKPQRGLTTVISTRVVEPRWGSWLRVHRRPRVRLRDPGLRNATALRYLHTSTRTALDSKAQGRRPGAPWVVVPNEDEKPQRGLTTVISTRIVEPRWGSWFPVHRRPRVRLRDRGLRNVTALRYLHTSTPTALDSKAQGRRAGAPWVVVPSEHEKPQRGLTTVIGTRVVEPRWGSWLPVHRRPRVRLRDPGLRNVTALRYLRTSTPTALDSKAQGRRAGAPWVVVPNEDEKPQRGLTTVIGTRIVEPRWGSWSPVASATQGALARPWATECNRVAVFAHLYAHGVRFQSPGSRKRTLGCSRQESIKLVQFVTEV
ncbi:hypothetical protein Q31b_18190 [Novipirellula aureliae]|uniref:Uncharacterized protein n=1 Tax=Novipirellula aureliae TaxID=2527966 RepID=A0A5C6E3M5_9BACT|nr:hypothetical protein Q31b_18190 [Novipirellula aureliae]